MHPLMGLALAHPKQSSWHHLEGVGLQVDQEKQQPICRRWQRTALRGGVPAGGARLPVQAPVGHRGVEHGLKGRDQLLKLLYRQAGQIQHLRGASPAVGQAYTSHGRGLLSSEAQDTINRDELYYLTTPSHPFFGW